MRNSSDTWLALDLATLLGWACGTFAEEPRFGSHLLPSTKDNIGRFAEAYDQWLSEIIEFEIPDAIIYEAPTKFAKTNPATTIKLNGLAWHTEFVCRRRGIRVYAAGPTENKKLFTGNGRADKTMMFAEARRRGFRVRDDNEADAVAVWHLAKHFYAAPNTAEPPAARVTGRLI